MYQHLIGGPGFLLLQFGYYDYQQWEWDWDYTNKYCEENTSFSSEYRLMHFPVVLEDGLRACSHSTVVRGDQRKGFYPGMVILY